MWPSDRQAKALTPFGPDISASTQEVGSVSHRVTPAGGIYRLLPRGITSVLIARGEGSNTAHIGESQAAVSFAINFSVFRPSIA
jgi:hypothetical protein